ncbi:DUF6049 family protein [Ammonicoccus fulvus]|uniref:DUF6049 family protein n=1 Tax=Ammonicoccus fulvus TaxID=3138240 RepID=A0ABZ3FWL8_9ACTN
MSSRALHGLARQQPTPRRRRPRFRLVVEFLLAFVLVALGSLGPLGSAPPAHADETPPSPVSIHVQSLVPELPGRDDTVTIRAVASNDSDQPITQAQAVFWRSRPGMRSLSDLRDTVGSPPRDVSGAQIWTEGAYQSLTTNNQSPTWQPGEIRTFEVRAPVDSLGFPDAAGVYLVGAQVVGRLGGAPLGTQGQTRLLLPLAAEDAPVNAVPAAPANTVISAVILSSRPSMTEPGVFVDDHLAEELQPTGRLAQLLAAARRPEVSWLVDPALIEELTAMADGYVVRSANGEAPGAGQLAAREWLVEFDRLDTGRGFRVPFAVPDASMLQRADLAEVMTRADAAAGRLSDIAQLPLIAWSNDGIVDEAGIALEEEAEPRAILTSSPLASPALLEPLGTAPLINYTAATTAGGPEPGPSSQAHVRQRMLAESFLISLSEPGATTVRVIDTAEAAAADGGPDPSWTVRRTLPDLLQTRPAAWSGELAYAEPHRENELTEPRVEVLREVATNYQAYLRMLVDPEPASRTMDAALARSASSWWRVDQAGFDTYADPQVAAVDRLWSGQAITVTAQPSVLMSGQSGSFPMTVTNRLDQAVSLRLTFESFQPQRLSIPDMELEVGANQSVTVNVQPLAAANGPVRISAWATSPDGTAVSKRVWMTVEATDLGRVGWIIVIASGIVLLAATALRIRQVRHERRRAFDDHPARRPARAITEPPPPETAPEPEPRRRQTQPRGDER